MTSELNLIVRIFFTSFGTRQERQIVNIIMLYNQY